MSSKIVWTVVLAASLCWASAAPGQDRGQQGGTVTIVAVGDSLPEGLGLDEAEA